MPEGLSRSGRPSARMKAALLAGLVATVAVGLATVAQEHILTVRPDRETAQISPGGRTSVRVLIENNSPHEADDVDITFAPPEGLSIDPSHLVRAHVRPFGKAVLTFSLRATSALPPGEKSLPFEVLYTYCIDTQKNADCYQILEDLALPVSVEEGPLATTRSGSGADSPWHVVIPVLCAVLLAGAVFARWRTGLSFPLYGMLLLLAAGALAYGVTLRQPRQAQGIAAILCTSCVGIEEARRAAPTLSATAVASLKDLNLKLELLVFYAPWCQSCPYAEAMVKEMAAVTDRLAYRFVNVENERELARSLGVITSGRTVVPAIVRVDTGEVLFGAQDLERRLLRLLGAGP